MAEITLTPQRIKDLYLEKEEADKLKGSFCQILNQFYSEIELIKPMPGQTLKSAVALHETFFSANKLDIATIEEISNKADLRKSAFLRKQEEEELKQIEKKQKEAEESISEIAGKDIDVQEKKETPQESANIEKDSEENHGKKTSSDFEAITQFLSDKSPAFKLTSLHYLLSLREWKGIHQEIQEVFATAQQEQKKKIGLFEKIIRNKDQGLSLAKSLEEEEFGEMIKEFSTLAKKMDETGAEDENAFLKNFLHHFKSEPKRNYELLALVIVMRYCNNENVRAFLEKLYKKWPQKNEQKDKRIILEMTKRNLNIR